MDLRIGLVGLWWLQMKGLKFHEVIAFQPRSIQAQNSFHLHKRVIHHFEKLQNNLYAKISFFIPRVYKQKVGVEKRLVQG